jgi:hypothetical protein
MEIDPDHVLAGRKKWMRTEERRGEYMTMAAGVAHS